MTDTSEIDAIELSMRAIVDTSIERNSATGYFAAMYLGVTGAVKSGLETGIFRTPDRLVELTGVFANRYLEAWRRREAGERPDAAWAVAFDAADSWRPTVLQHLLVGMNAHINLDLGVACAQVAPGAAISELRIDFEQINDVLAGLVEQIQDELNKVSPLYRFVDDVTGSVDRAVINFSISRARAEAWKQAEILAAATPAAAAQHIADLDRVVALIGGAIVHPGVIASTGLLAVRLTELRQPTAIIDVLTGAVASSH